MRVFLVAAALLIAVSTPSLAAEVNPGVLCTAVVERACEGIDTIFPANVGKVYAHTRILGMEGGGSVTHRWIFKGQTMAEIKLNIGGADWRTWSSKTIDPLWSGDWKVEVVDDGSGQVLTTLEFSVNE